jgi:hypothetical protein
MQPDKKNHNPPHFHHFRKRWNGVVWNKETARMKNYKVKNYENEKLWEQKLARNRWIFWMNTNENEWLRFPRGFNDYDSTNYIRSSWSADASRLSAAKYIRPGTSTLTSFVFEITLGHTTQRPSSIVSLLIAHALSWLFVTQRPSYVVSLAIAHALSWMFVVQDSKFSQFPVFQRVPHCVKLLLFFLASEGLLSMHCSLRSLIATGPILFKWEFSEWAILDLLESSC